MRMHELHHPERILDRTVIRRKHHGFVGVTGAGLENDDPAIESANGWDFDFVWPSDNEAEGQLREGRVRLISIQGTAQPLAWVVSRTRRSRMPLAEFPAAAGPAPSDGRFLDLSPSDEVASIDYVGGTPGPWRKPAAEESQFLEWPVEFKRAAHNGLSVGDFKWDGNVPDTAIDPVSFNRLAGVKVRTFLLSEVQKPHKATKKRGRGRRPFSLKDLPVSLEWVKARSGSPFQGQPEKLADGLASIGHRVMAEICEKTKTHIPYVAVPTDSPELSVLEPVKFSGSNIRLGAPLVRWNGTCFIAHSYLAMHAAAPSL